MSKKIRVFLCALLAAANIVTVFAPNAAVIAEEIAETEEVTEETTAEQEGPADGEEQETDEEQMPEVTPVPTPTAIPQEPENETEAQTQTDLIFNGSDYSVNVSYGPGTGLPSDLDLVVSEIPAGDVYDEYLGLTSDALGNPEIGTARFFDISLMKDGSEMEPAEGTSVAVTISLNSSLNSDVNVVHINNESEASVVDISGITENGGTEVSFDAEGFSVYAVVDGPRPAVITPKQVADTDELKTLTEEDFIVISYSNRYATNSVNDKNALTETSNITTASGFYLESVDLSGDKPKFYICTNVGTEKKYLKNTSDNLVDLVTSGGTVFEFEQAGDSKFYIKVSGENKWLQHSNGGNGIRLYTDKNNAANSQMSFTYVDSLDLPLDPYKLNGKTYGLVNYSNSLNGYAMMGTARNTTELNSASAVVRKDPVSGDGRRVYVTQENDISFWTFRAADKDSYRLSTKVNGRTKYLQLTSSGMTMTDNFNDASLIKVVPGAEGSAFEGQFRLVSGGYSVTCGNANGFKSTKDASAANHYLEFVEPSELVNEDFVIYSAQKISVSDTEHLGSGSKVIVYTRVWNDLMKRYEYYAVDHDGTLMRCYESGDVLQWAGSRLNTLLWDFTIYYWDESSTDKDNENGYYELYNEYSQKYMAPQITNGQILSDDIIGINLNGRKYDNYYSTIVAWDDTNYSYAGLKTEGGSIVSDSFYDAADFYFAIIQDVSEDPASALHTVDTVDNSLYGIEMKIVDYNGATSKYTGCTSTIEQHNVIGVTAFTATGYTAGLLSTNLGNDGYPVSTETGISLGQLYTNAYDVNHLFVESTHNATGYFEYDSTQSFATLVDQDGNPRTDFTVYQELGTTDSSSKNTLKHGQFLPFNTIVPGVFASKNPYNLYGMGASTATGHENDGILPDTDPRKNERLYKVEHDGQTADYYFGVELSTSFIQTPDGLDDWDHDIIYEFTGDDDFWLYVDGELVIDLGGVHSALKGTVNYATGEVEVNGQKSYLRDIFYNNYKGRDHTDAEAQAYVDEIFTLNKSGQYVFKEYTTHKMKIFYMERGGGASNLHMKFNQSSVTPGTVVLGKELDGADLPDTVMAQFPYQIYYLKEGETEAEAHLLNNNDPLNISVKYRGTNRAVTFDPEFVLDGVTYQDVFFLKPGEECEISFPSDAISYKVVECGVNDLIYSKVYVNGVEIAPDQTGTSTGRSNYGIDYETAEDRSNVKYVNEVDPDAVKTLNIRKQLYKEDGVTELDYEDDQTPFNFRLYLAGEYDGEITEANKGQYPANMYTYHVKDENGNYCRWDSATQRFISIGTSDFSSLDADTKQSISFQTSMNGSISKIPAGYYIEVRGLMVGSHFMVEERDNEVPDGYSRRDYYYYQDDGDTSHETSLDPVAGEIVEEKDPLVVVNNLKGYGLRVNKVWTDADYMVNHDDIFFAVYTKNGSALDLIDGTVHRVSTKQKTSYWYFQTLQTGLTLDDYVIREVELTGAYTVDSEGVVTVDSSDIRCLDEGDTIDVGGKMIGADAPGTQTYTVSYDTGSVLDGSNIRVDTTTNDRPGLKLLKYSWDGNTPLADATFTLVSADGTYRKTFTSDSDGNITKAYLNEGVTYYLTEIKTPAGYYCPTESIEIMIEGGQFVVAGDSDFGDLDVEDDGADKDLTIKNIPYTLTAVKTDGTNPLAGAHFALHKQITVGNVTMINYNPMPGYEDLVSGPDGVIPGIDNTLPEGTYELREITPPASYNKLTHYVRFTISSTGGVVLNSLYSDVDLDSDLTDGHMTYVMSIENSSDGEVMTISKTVQGNMGSRDKFFEFEVTLTDANGNILNSIDVTYNDGRTETIDLDSDGKGQFYLSHDQSMSVTLPVGTTYTITELDDQYQTTYSIDGGAEQQGKTVMGVLDDTMSIDFTNTLGTVIPTGVKTSVNLLISAFVALIAGIVINFFRNYRRRISDDEQG
ncbi:MAG: hypothetical protein IKE53_03725 [Clostridiales bacterium]|nr:hypothetical protein [Clostridiales bacterium]